MYHLRIVAYIFLARHSEGNKSLHYLFERHNISLDGCEHSFSHDGKNVTGIKLDFCDSEQIAQNIIASKCKDIYIFTVRRSHDARPSLHWPAFTDPQRALHSVTRGLPHHLKSAQD